MRERTSDVLWKDATKRELLKTPRPSQISDFVAVTRILAAFLCRVVMYNLIAGQIIDSSEMEFTTDECINRTHPK